MNDWQQFVWLSFQALGILTLPPILVVGFACGIGASLIGFKQRHSFATLWQSPYWGIFTQLLFFPAMIGVAVLGGARFQPPPKPNQTQELYINILLLGSVLLAAFWVYRSKGLRWFTFCSVVALQLIVFGAFLVASMAISGSWL